ncbi:hypothetical protein ACFX2I_007534 [Malus domestica]
MKEEAHSPEAFGGSFQRRIEVEGDKNMTLSNSNDCWALLESGLIDKNMAIFRISMLQSLFVFTVLSL